MEVDLEPPKTPPSGHALLPPVLISEPLPADLSQLELDALNKSMNQSSSEGWWPMRIDNVKEDPSKLRNIFAEVLFNLSSELPSNEKFIGALVKRDATKLIESLDDKELQEWTDGLKEGVYKSNWQRLVSHPMLSKPVGVTRDSPYVEKEAHLKILRTAYNKPFLGDTAKDLVKYLNLTEDEIRSLKKVAKKTFPIVQSSGTGKSRMLTETGKHIFTIPICLRAVKDAGYPPGDVAVVEYFASFTHSNDLSYTAHVGVACFIAGVHKTMLKWLEDAQKRNVGNLLSYWHEIMEPAGERDERNKFFVEAVGLARSLQKDHLPEKPSPHRKPGNSKQESEDINTFARITYQEITAKATDDLMKFLSTIGSDALCVTYFDEAHGLGTSFWVLLRLLRCQQDHIRMWYIFLGTKSDLSYYSPQPDKLHSLKMREEITQRLPPYVALGFDQHVIADSQTPKTVTMGELQSIEHLSRYGRPMWNAELYEGLDLIVLAADKLTNGQQFSADDNDHVFSVLSQRLCLEPVLAGSEAVKLAERSVADHMRLLTGFSGNGALFYTHSPSEPILALGSSHLLYNTTERDQLRDSLKTLNFNLCKAGLIEKGLVGELAARTLLLVARDFSAPTPNGQRDLLKPVRLLHFLNKLFGNDKWAGTDQEKFNGAFAEAYVNFTHWSVTKDAMPVEPDLKLLSNLWARGAALQCCFNQFAIDFMIPVYHGSVDADAVFDPSLLTGFPGQVKLKDSGDPRAATVISLIGIPRDLDDPLPYLALLMEFGTESPYKAKNSPKIKTTSAGPLSTGMFSSLTSARNSALQKYTSRLQQVGNKKRDAELTKLKKQLTAAQLDADSYNRYSISVHGGSPEVYGILKEANITEQFRTLLMITTPLPGSQEATLEHMRPLERLGELSNHTAWMSEYLVPGEAMDLD